MSKVKICKNCQKFFAPNPRLKGKQNYCGKKACQRKRKTQWEQNKNREDSSYRERQRQSKKRWRDNHPGHEYQKQYRESHPKYEEKNRFLQKKRNAKRILSTKLDKILTKDTYSDYKEEHFSSKGDNCKDGHVISETLVNSGLYAILPYNSKTRTKIVKMDALIVQLINLQ